MLELLVANKKNRIHGLPSLAPAGMKAGFFYHIGHKDLIPLPNGSELFLLPDRPAVGYEKSSGSFLSPAEDLFAVSAFVSPGFTVTYNPAYLKNPKAKILPLFSYAVVCSYKGKLYVTAKRVDRELRQDISLMDISLIKKNVKVLKILFPKNRLMRHLEGCALCYSCPAAKNFFLKRYEAPLPTSPTCNASCVGCISYQSDKGCAITQPRINFIPTPQEIAEVAIFHIQNVDDPVVSFGQGCEGEPLLVADTIEKAITLIRETTKKGIINLNTNASRPRSLKKLFNAGLDSIRVSLNSVQKKYYDRYYRPKSYEFKDVIESIKIAKKKNRFISLNYFVFPGFTDERCEFSKFKKFLHKYHIDMVQLRNLNIDPTYYTKSIGYKAIEGDLLGIDNVISSLKRDFPKVMLGYFNPSKNRMRRFKLKI